MNRGHILAEFEGVYGGPQARDLVLRLLKESLALVENSDPADELLCSSFRLEWGMERYDFEGIYGGSQSRDIVLRLLKELLALVEDSEQGSELICSGFRIEQFAAPT